MDKVVTRKTKLVVVLLDAEELVAFFPNWPDTISLAVCLLPSGEHHFVFYHVDEAQLICGRLERLLKISNSELEVTPKVNGYNTRPVLFSDNQLIWSLITDSPEALEEATDYAANYRYAVEEGLDPTQFWGFESGLYEDSPSEVSPSQPRQDSADEVAQHLVNTQKTGAGNDVVEKPSLTLGEHQIPSFLKLDSARPNPRFFEVPKLEKQALQAEKWRIHPENDGYIVFESTSSSGLTERVERQDQVFASKDFTEIAVRSNGLAFDQGLPRRMVIKADMLPNRFRSDLGGQQQQATLEIEGYFFHFLIEEKTVITPRIPAMSSIFDSTEFAAPTEPFLGLSFIKSLSQSIWAPIVATKLPVRTIALILLVTGVSGFLSDATAVSRDVEQSALGAASAFLPPFGLSE